MKINRWFPFYTFWTFTAVKFSIAIAVYFLTWMTFDPDNFINILSIAYDLKGPIETYGWIILFVPILGFSFIAGAWLQLSSTIIRRIFKKRPSLAIAFSSAFYVIFCVLVVAFWEYLKVYSSIESSWIPTYTVDYIYGQNLPSNAAFWIISAVVAEALRYAFYYRKIVAYFSKEPT